MTDNFIRLIATNLYEKGQQNKRCGLDMNSEN